MSSEKTSVQVAVRIRPITNEDLINLPTRFQKSVLSTAPYAPNQVIVAGEKKQYFSYDHVFGPETTQKDIYDKAVLKLIDKFLEGYNVTILAYGQTSSGKTFTMGTSDNDLIEPEEKGIIPRAVSTLFSSMESAQYKTRKFSIKVSFIEIYNEDLIDLLGEGEGESRPQVLIREDSKGNILWSGLQEIKVNNVEEVMAHLKRGSLSRQTGATDMNSKSSRSHAIFSVTLAQQKFVPASGSNSSSQTLNDSQQKPGMRPPSRSSSRLSRRFDEGEWISVTSKFHFVDLAGSERLKRTSATGDRVKEGISINSGLLALGNVISALGDPNKAKHTTHVPYRDSKLTRLLQDSLGGNAQTLMIACVSPAEYNLTETVNTLKYANRARNIKNNATINAEEAGWNDLEHLQNLVLKLRNEIKTLKSASGVVNSNMIYTNGTSSGRSTPITSIVNGRETPSHLRRPSTPSNLPQSLSGKETPSNLKRSSTPSNLSQSLSGRETPSNLKRPSTPSNLPIVSHHVSQQQQQQQQQQKSQSNKDVESLEDQLKQLKYSYVKLSQRYAKTSAELAKHQDNDENSNNSDDTLDDDSNRNSLSVIKEVDDEKFQEAVEPVIEEYEKSFTLLESQLAITKAALSHSEFTIKEQQTKLDFAEQSNEQSKILIGELKNKIAKLTESETSMERYIKDLEIKLEDLSSDQKKDQDLINELKSEISQMKVNGNNSEGYIQDLESRLCTSEGQSAKLTETIVKLEKRLQQRENAYLELEERLKRVEADEEKELLLGELDNREKRILILEQNVESLMNELEELKKLKEYEDFSLPRDASGLTPNNLRSITPVNDNDTTLIATLESRLSELQKTHEKTLQEFENIKSKYQSCLLEIHDLQSQLTEAKLIHSETVKSTPTTPMSPQSPGLGNSFRLSLPPLSEVNDSLNVNNNLTFSKHKRSKSFSTEVYGPDKKDGAHLAVIQRLKNEIQQLSSLHEDKTQGLDAVKQEFARLEISYRATLDIVEELREEIKRRDALAQLEVMSVMTVEHAERSYHSVNHSEVDELEIVQRLREEVEQLKEEQRITMESLSERERESLKGHNEVLKIESTIRELQEELRYILEQTEEVSKAADADNERIIELQSRIKELEQELLKSQESQRQEQIADAASRLEGSLDSSETGKNNDSSSNEENLALRRQIEKLQLDIESKSHTIATLLLPTAEHQNTISRLEDELQEVREAMKDNHNKLVINSEGEISSQFIEQEEEPNVEEIIRELEAKAKDLEAQLIKAKEAQHIPTPRNSFLQVVDPTQRDISKLQDKLSDLQKELALKSETIQNLESEKELVVSLQSQLEILKNDIKRKYELIEVLKRDLVDKGILQQKLREKEAEATALQSQLLTVKKRDSEMQNQMEVLQSQLLKLEGGDSSLHNELENVRKELKEAKENEKFSIERLRVLNAEESKLQQDLQRLRQGDIAQKERINVLESKLSQESLVVEDLTALMTELSLAKEVEVTQQQKISELENKLKDSETEVSSLQSKIAEMKSKSTSDDSQIQNLVSDIKDLRVLENEQKQHVETLENKLKKDELMIVDMKDELAKLKEAESQLRSTIQELEDKLVKAQKENEQIQIIKDEINLLKDLCTEQNSKIEQLHSELEETQSAKDAAIKELESQKKDFANQKELVITLENELKNVREELVKANEKIIDNDKKLEELSNELYDTKKQQDEEEEKKKLLENEIESLKSAEETSNEDVNNLKAELTTLKMEKEARNKRLSEIENQIHITEKERDQHLERVNELIKMVDTKEVEKKEAVSVLENKVSDLQSQLEQVKESSRVDQETIENFEEKLVTLSSQLEVAKESNEKYTQIIGELETKLKESNALLSEKEQSLSDKNSKYVELEAIIEKARAELENSKASEVANNNQIKQLEIDLQEFEIHNNQQSELIQALESQLQEAEEQRSDHISKLAEANSEIEILKEKCLSIQSEINEVNDDSLLHGYSNVDENAVEELSKELKKFQEEAQVQQEHADILQKKIDKLQSEKNTQLVINADLAQQVEQLQKDLESLAEEFAETATKQEDNEIQMKERISELETALEEATKDDSNPYLTKLAEANENLRQTNYDLNSKIAEAEKRASSLSEKVKTLESELECTKSTGDSLKAKVQELEAEKRVLNQANDSSLEERQKLDQRIETLIQQLQTSGRNGNKTATHLAELNTKILSLEKEIAQAKQKAKEDTSEILKLKEINEQLEQELKEDTVRDSGNSLDSGYISQVSTPRTLKKIDSPTQFKFYRQESTIAQQNHIIKTLQERINELERQAEENSSRSGTPIAADLDAVGGYRATSPTNPKSAVRPPPTPPPNQPLPRVPPSPSAPPISPPPRVPLPPKPDSAPDLTVEKLNKRITKLEGDNLQNRQLVDTLENSLNDSETNLRVAKQQLQILQREKSDLINQTKSLKMQLEDAAAQYEHAKSSVQQEKKFIENVLLEERKAKEQAERSKLQLESRMEELIAKKSKFMCF